MEPDVAKNLMRDWYRVQCCRQYGTTIPKETTMEPDTTENIDHPKKRCLKCNDIIQSMHRHDFKWCKCQSVFIDGGKDYLRYGGDMDNILIIEGDE